MSRRKQTHLGRAVAPILSTVLLVAAGCDPVIPGEGEGEGEGIAERDIARPLGGTSFLSADGQAGQSSPDDRAGGDFDSGAPAAPEAGEDTDDGDRTVEEGDIYRVMAGGLIANLNAFRGLQIIDVNDVAEPRIVGRLQISGHPVEMYVDGDRVYILMNNWYGYYGVRADLASLGQLNGGVVVAVDISDPTSPVLLDQTFVPGYISKSRLTKGNVSRALYVVASRYDSFENDDGTWSYQTRTRVESFDVSSGAIVEKSELDLGGYVTDIQATPEALLVARHDWSWSGNGYAGSRVALIDISSPDGTMVVGDEVQVAGYVQNQFRMDLYNGVLRVASGSQWGGSNTNHIQTFDASDLSNLTLLDEATYGDGESLFATLFLGNKAFAVTYLRVDPFHAFSIADDGTITEESEFVVSGWNDFFKPAFDDSRLIGIGINDELGRSMSVSLYDITDLSNANPLVARAEVEADYSWSEASWDHRAFSVIEGATSITGPNGEEETGLVLLPFSGWSDDYDTYTAAVQIFTFSPTSLTRRGLMLHGTPVRRSFAVDDELTGNLSEAELSLFGTADPANPVEHGRVELAPNYSDVLEFGDYAARVNGRSDYYYGWYAAEEPPASIVEIIPRSAHPDTAEAVAAVEVPANSQLYAAGDQLVAITTRVTSWEQYPYEYETRIRTFDLSDPTVPVATGELVTDRIVPGGYYGGGYYWGDCWDCGYRGYYGPSSDVAPLDGGIAFLQREHQQELLGTEEVCNTYAYEPSNCTNVDGASTCTYLQGSVTCRQLEGEDEALCTGGFRRCTYTSTSASSSYTCEAVDADELATQTSCWTNQRYRYWTSFSLEVLDLRSPESPTLLDTIELPVDDEGVSMVRDGARVWISYKRPEDVPGTSLPYVRYFAKKIDLSNLDNPTVGNGINVPGELLAANGNRLYTRDYVWGDEIVETTLNRVAVSGGLAYLEAIHELDNQIVSQVTLDGAGHALVTHQLAWQFVSSNEDYATRLTVLDADGAMDALSTTLVDSWATLKDARAGRALFQVPGGLLVLNLDDASAPSPQAFFALRGWPSRIHVQGDDVVVPAGRYGVYRFGLDDFNLLPPPM